MALGLPSVSLVLPSVSQVLPLASLFLPSVSLVLPCNYRSQLFDMAAEFYKCFYVIIFKSPGEEVLWFFGLYRETVGCSRLCTCVVWTAFFWAVAEIISWFLYFCKAFYVFNSIHSFPFLCVRRPLSFVEFRKPPSKATFLSTIYLPFCRLRSRLV